ncbi:MAG TPA: HD-GYP domain-containing protein [Burkholderiaceae bacterium]|nr:HD-GYP domain-containing protein [Burkholderiaceae bacterium]
MLQEIAVAELRLGMYVAKVPGSWLAHPFWRTHFRLADAHDLALLKASGIRSVWIDTAKSDTAAGSAPTDAPAAAAQRHAPAAITAAVAPAPVALENEMARAEALLKQARGVVKSMFGDARMGQALQTDQALQLVDEVNASVERNAGALLSLAHLKARDDALYQHAIAVCALMVALARRLGLPPEQVRAAGMAGLLHDIGKARLPDSILNKRGRLSEVELERMRKHPEIGYRLLRASGVQCEVALDACLHHHERPDGRGYPHGLRGGQIGLHAGMLAVCDMYDTITSAQPYAQASSPDEAIHRMAQCAASQFDQHTFHAFVRAVGIFPVGSLVRLASDRLALVIENDPQALLTPRVKVVYSVARRSLLAPLVIDLARQTDDRIVARVDPAEWGLGSLTRLRSRLHQELLQPVAG